MTSGLAGRRIAIVLASQAIGGAERQALLLARHLATGHGAHVIVHAPPPDGPVRSWCMDQGVAFAVLPAMESRRSWLCRLRMWRVARRLAATSPEVIASFTWPANIACARYRRATGATVVIWGQRDAGINRLIPGLEVGAARGVDLAVANSPAGLAGIARCGVVGVPTVMVPNAVALAAPAADRDHWRARLAIPWSAPVAVMLAHLHANKDHATLLRAWRDVVAAQPDAVLVLAGRDAGTASDLRRQAEALGIAAAVRMPGEIADVTGLLHASDLAVLCSRSEGCPNGLLEAMAVGLAVAATAAPGIAWAIEDADQLAPIGDGPALAARILALIADPGRRHRLGERNRAVIAARFAPGPALEAHADAIARALASAESADMT